MPFNDLIRQRMPPLTAAFTSNRIFLYVVFSVVATVTTIANACRNYSNFYSVSIYLSRSGRSLLVLANFGFLSALLSGRILQRIFFGPLQSREVERLYDQTWMFVTESLLAFTIFRDDFDIPFVIMFGFLLFVKCFHWLMADRVESMDQVPYPGPPLLFHIRMNTLLFILWVVDFIMLVFAVESTLSNGVGGMVLFASEYAILMASAMNSMARYTLSNLEIRRARARGGANAPAWESKSMHIFYIELVTDFLKLVVYLTFFVIVLTFYGLPLNMIRDVYLTARSFTTRLRALIRYHNATRDMDRRYPNATEEELTAMSDRTCIICREEMVAPPQNQNPPAQEAPANANANNAQDGPNVTPKKLPCGHIFHFQCLRSWLERQQSCPTCRRTVLETEQPNRNNAQAAARNARPGVPQPGANPAAGRPGQQAPNGPVPMGWLGRLLGIAVQPPLIPGQFPNGQGPPQFIPPGAAGPQQVPANAGWPAPGQQLPPGYMYPFPYQLQHQLPPQQLQPPPVYRGFYGPGGVWQPWGVDAQWLAQGQQAQGQHVPAQQPQPQTNPQAQAAANPAPAQPPASTAPPPTVASISAPENSQTPIPTISSVQQPQGDPSSGSSTSGDESASNGSDRPSTPRDAAALAALRRLNSSRPSVLAPDAGPSSASVTAASPDGTVADTGPSATSPPRDPVSDPSSSPSVASATPSSSSSTTTVPQNQVEVPSLIPLYDFAPPQRSVYNSYLLSPHLRPGLPRMQGPNQPPIPSAQTHRGSSHAQSSTRTPAQEPQPRYRPGASRAPLSQLPPTLTDEQLSRLDRLTRDAIDERLRVLEGVSGAVYRCIEELTRIRSVLPPRDQAIVTPLATSAEGSSTSNPGPELTPSVTPVPAADVGPRTDKDEPVHPAAPEDGGESYVEPIASTSSQTAHAGSSTDPSERVEALD